MVWGCDLVGDTIFLFLQKVVELSIDEVRTSVAYDCTWHTKTRENYLLKESIDNLRICSWAWYGFYPLGHVIHSYEDVFFVARAWKRSHEIDPP